MVGIYITDAADIARAEGITKIKEWSGWQTRSASQGGFSQLMGVIIHHTASPVSWRGDKDWNYTLTNTSNAPEYLAGIDPDGRLNILCAGGANSSGKGGPLNLSTGVVPQSGANYRLAAVCFGNTGDGSEPYSVAAIDTGVKFVGGLCRRYGWDTGAITAHKEWCGPGTSTPGRKIDPFGPWAQGGDWGPQQGRIDAFRGLVFNYLVSGPGPSPTPPPEEEDDVARYLIQHPADGTWYLTDTATYKTVVQYPGSDEFLEMLRNDGVVLFGWQGDGDGRPWLVGPQWGAHLDSLPTLHA